MTAAEYMRLVETANKRRADAHRKGHPEHDLQVACVAWFRAQYPKDAAMLFAVPNGGHRNAIEAARMKAEGVTPGVADLILLEARGGYGALCIEMKTRRKGSGQSSAQRLWQQAVEWGGAKYVVCRDFAAFCREVTAYLSQNWTGTNTGGETTASDLYTPENAAKSAKDAKF